MHPLCAGGVSALDPLDRAVAFLLLHANVAVVVGLDLLAALAAVELAPDHQVLIVLQLVGAHLALEAELAHVLARLPGFAVALLQPLEPPAIVVRVGRTDAAVEVVLAHCLEADRAELALLTHPEVDIVLAVVAEYQQLTSLAVFQCALLVAEDPAEEAALEGHVADDEIAGLAALVVGVLLCLKELGVEGAEDLLGVLLRQHQKLPVVEVSHNAPGGHLAGQVHQTHLLPADDW